MSADAFQPSGGPGGIAIIGLAGRFPGARDISQFWQNLRDGVESITRFSEEELRAAGISAGMLRDARYVRAAPLLEGADLFDAAFFGYSPREAQVLDPQHRLFLECAWEALENAGYDPLAMPVPVGVYGGAGGLVTSYFLSQMAADRRHLGRTASLAHIANDKDFLTTRVSYKLNLRGPSFNVQTACSTSLVAVHLACQSLLCHECDAALAGGVSVRVPLKAGYLYEDGGIVSPDGHCRSFDAAAQGTVFGSGVGMVVLKRLADALADGDHIRAVIKGSAINNDGGAKLSYASASEAGQAAAISEALAVAEFAPETVSMVEAHGTATALGDPVEVSALTKAFHGPGVRPGGCALGSVKSNIGHLDAAAGVTGLIKTVLALEHRQIPPSLHYANPNPRIDFSRSPFFVNASLREWPAGPTRRRAGVNSLGVGGTNAFVALEEAPARLASSEARPFELLCVSARSEGALSRLAQCYVEHLDTHPDASLADLCFTAAVGRTPFAERLAVVADSCAGLRRLLADAAAPRRMRGRAPVTPSELATLPALDRTSEDLQHGLEVLGAQWVRGARVNWTEFYHGRSCRRAPLPAYPFERERYWLEPEALPWRAPDPPGQATAFPGRRLSSPLSEIQFEIELGPLWPMLADHRVYDRIVVPGAWHLAMVLAAARDTFGSGSIHLRNILFPRALTFAEAESCLAQTLFRPGDKGAAFEVWSRPSADGRGRPAWSLHAQGEVSLAAGPGALLEPLHPAEVEGRCAESIPLAEFYQRMRERRIDLGPAFQWNARVSSNESETLSRIFPPITESDGFLIHPGLVDSCIQLVIARLSPTYLPLSIERIRFDPSLATPSWIYAHLHPAGTADAELRIADVRITDESGRVVLAMDGLTVKRATQVALLGEAEWTGPESWFYSLAWQPSPLSENTPPLDGCGHWLIFADAGGTGPALAALLEKHGQLCVRVFVGAECARDGDCWQINPARREDFRRLLSEATLPDGWRGIIYLWGADIASPDQACCDAVVALVQELAERSETAPHLWLVTRGAETVGTEIGPPAVAQAPLWGLGRVIATEHPDFHCTLVDLDPVRRDGVPSLLFEELLSGAGEDQVALRDGTRFAARLVRRSPVPEIGSSRLCIASRGILSELQLNPTERHPPAAGEVEIRVHAAGLNFRDVLNALGTYPGDAGELGLECAGEIAAVGQGVEDFRVGDEVMAVAFGAFATFVTTSAQLTVRKPAGLSMEEAATIPVAFLTAHYAVNHLAGLVAGQSVLIHAAAGGVGLAAVQLARRAGAEIHATAGRPEKHAYLRSIGLRSLMSSRDAHFADELAQRISGDGVDLVLNSLTGDFIPAGLSVLRDGGHFIELGKTGIWTAEQVAAVRPRAAYSRIALDTMFTEQPALVARMLRELCDAFEAGELEPLPRHTFPLTEAAQAFRYMAQAKHIGKIVFTLPPGAGQRRRAPLVRRDGTYLITGGFGALGLRAARWLAAQGARQLVLIGRCVPSPSDLKSVLPGMDDDVQVRAERADVADFAAMERLLASIAATLPPLRGIIHAAGVLDDGILRQQTPERFAVAMRPKVAGAWNLHTLTGNSALDFFVMFSSAASLLGSGGQANYAAANAFLDALAHFRRAQHLPALSINWGPWAEAGMAAALGEAGWQRFAAVGIEPIPVPQGFEALGCLLHDGSTQAMVMPVDWRKFLRQYEGAAPSILHGFAALRHDRCQPASSAAQAVRSEPGTPESPNSGRGYFSRLVETHVRQILGLEESHVLDPARSLTSLGLDSLLAVELLNAVSKASGCKLPTSVVFNQPTIEAMTDYLADHVASDANRRL